VCSCYAFGNATLQSLQAAVALMLRDIGAVHRDDQAVEASCCQTFNVARQEPAVGDDCAGYACRDSLRDEADDVRMHQRLAALQRHVTDPAPMQDREGLGEGIRADVPRSAGQCLVSCKTAEFADGIAEVCDGDVTNGR